MANVTESLKQVAKANREELSATSAITEAQRLIADKGADDMKMLYDMGMHTSVARAMDLHGKKMELEKLENQHGNVYTIQEIEKVACKYALKFRRSDSYKGAIDPAMLQSLKEFFFKGGIDMNAAKLGYNCYVLAPAKAFRLIDRPAPVPPDPILFYKLDENNYKLVHKWGSDLTPFRRLVGLKYRNRFTYWLTWFIPFAAATFLSSVWLHSMPTNAHKSCATLLVAALTVFLGILSGFVPLNRAFSDDGGQFKKWSVLWKDEYKPKL